jgi:hypothetical protein
MGLVFMKINPNVADRKGFPEIISTHGAPRSISHITASDFIFSFQEGKTIYYKDRYATDYQYTEEERLILMLKAVHM